MYLTATHISPYACSSPPAPGKIAQVLMETDLRMAAPAHTRLTDRCPCWPRSHPAEQLHRLYEAYSLLSIGESQPQLHRQLGGHIEGHLRVTVRANSYA